MQMDLTNIPKRVKELREILEIEVSEMAEKLGVAQEKYLAYDLSEETQAIARQLMWSISIIIVFQATNSIMTKGVLRGGDTKVLMLSDNIVLWVASIPLGALAGLVLHLPAFWIYFALKIDQVLKAVWCVIRLNSGKWIKKIRTESEI